MEISPPFGYKEVVPLQKNQKVALLKAGEIPPFVRDLNAIPVSFAEFAKVAHNYPLVFTSGDQGKTFAPVAVLGMTGGENLFVSKDAWAANTYVPAYARRFPFCMAKVTANGIEQQERLICVEKGYAGDKGEAMFDAKGEPLPRWKEIELLLSEYEVDLERTREMCAVLADYGLLESFNMQATLAKGGSMQLGGMYRVDENKVAELNASQLKNLVKKGIMGRIYAHLLSMENFTGLLERKSKAAA